MVRAIVDALIRSIFPSGDDDLNLQTMDARDHSGQDIAAACESLPMFAERRVIRVTNAQDLKGAHLEAVAHLAADPPPSTLLILEADQLDRRLKGVTTLLASAHVRAVVIDQVQQADAEQSVARWAQQRGLQLAKDVPGWLVEAVGASLQALEQAVEKIDLFLGPAGDGQPRRVTIPVAEEIVADTRTRSVFELTDALLERNADKTLFALRSLLEHGESPVGVVNLAARQLRGVLVVQDMAARGRRDERAMAQAAGVPPFVVRKLEGAARRFRPAELRELLTALMQADHALKSSRLPDRIITERVLLAICLGPARNAG